MMKEERRLCQENENIEIRLLLEAIYQKYGYDFRDYSKAHIKRRIKHRMRLIALWIIFHTNTKKQQNV